MIAKVLRGWRPGGLLRYLFGPGRCEEHRDPRVVASWDGAPWVHQPERLAAVLLGGERVDAGEFDFDLGPLTQTMQELAEYAGLPVAGLPALDARWAELLATGQVLPADAPPWAGHYRYDPVAKAVVLRPGYVWHCSVRLHPDDPRLSDEQWEQIAQRLVGAAGIARAGCRWVAVRHADDHIHVMAVLVSEATGRRFHPYRDFPKLRAECQRLEREFGLVATAGIDRTASSAPTRGELAKAARLGRPGTAREALRRVVGQCAATTAGSEQFLVELAREGLDPRVRRGADGRVCGYTVAATGDRTADGRPVRYAGGTLAPDLSWPKLLARWADTPAVTPLPRNDAGRVTRAGRGVAVQDAVAVVERATAWLRADADRDADGVAHAAGEVLAALGRIRDGGGGGPVAELAGRYDRACRTPHQVLPQRSGLIASELRQAARRLGQIGRLHGRGSESVALVALLLALGALVAEIGAWQRDLGRVHQAAVARTTARGLPELADQVAGPDVATVPAAARRPSGLAPHLRPRPPARPDRYQRGRRDQRR